MLTVPRATTDGGWVLGVRGEGNQSEKIPPDKLAGMCPGGIRVVPDGVHSVFPRARLHEAEGKEALWNTWGA